MDLSDFFSFSSCFFGPDNSVLTAGDLAARRKLNLIRLLSTYSQSSLVSSRKDRPILLFSIPYSLSDWNPRSRLCASPRHTFSNPAVLDVLYWHLTPFSNVHHVTTPFQRCGRYSNRRDPGDRKRSACFYVPFLVTWSFPFPFFSFFFFFLPGYLVFIFLCFSPGKGLKQTGRLRCWSLELGGCLVMRLGGFNKLRFYINMQLPSTHQKRRCFCFMSIPL